MNLCFDMLNRHRPITALLVSMMIAMFLNIANYSLVLAQEPATERFAGSVKDENGIPLNAMVTINGVSTQADDEGFFVIYVPHGEGDFYRISADKVGYAPISYVHIGFEISDLELILRNTESFQFKPEEGIDAEDSAGTRIQIPANSWVDADGILETVPLTLTLLIYTYDLQDEEIPGDMSGLNDQGQIVFMKSVGAFHARFVDEDGKEYNLRDGFTAVISVELESAEEIGEPITLWFFDDVSGLWIEEGSAVQNGNRVEGAVSHFSLWTFSDTKLGPACIRIEIDVNYWVQNGQLIDIEARIPSENEYLEKKERGLGPHILHNLPPNTDVEFYSPPKAPFPFMVVNTGAPWEGPEDPNNPQIPNSPAGTSADDLYTACNGRLEINDTASSTAQISGKKYHDINGNGIQDSPGEPGLANWTILLQGSNGATINAVTNGDGSYLFDNLPAGTYTVTENFRNKQGWAQTMPKTGFYTTTLTTGQTVSDLDFGNWEYQDESCVTHWDVHIPLNLPYVEFHMGIHNRTPSAHNYTIEVLPFPGLEGLTNFTTTPDTPINILAGESESLLVRVDPKPTMDEGVKSIDFQVIVTNLETGMSFGCGGRMWNQNTNLVMFPSLGADPIPPQVQLGRPARVGMVIENRRNQDIEGVVVVDAMFDAEEGGPLPRRNQQMDVLSINGLPAGENYREEIFIPADESISFEVEVALTADIAGVGDILFSLDEDGDGEEDAVTSILLDAGLFAERQGGEIYGRKWHDLNGNGIQDADEPGISGAIVILQTPDGESITTTTTDENGDYSFKNLVSGDYVVVCAPPEGMALTQQDAGSDDTVDSEFDPDTGKTDIITVSAGEIIGNINAGLTRTSGTITGVVFKDANGDSVQDAGDSTIAGVTVQLLDKVGNVLEVTTTDSNGNYSFVDLDPTRYIIQFDAPSDTDFVEQDVGTDDTVDSDADPATGKTDPIFVSANSIMENISAGLSGQGATPGPDLYIRDTPGDEGIEPNPVPEHMWLSESIWVRNDALEHYSAEPFVIGSNNNYPDWSMFDPKTNTFAHQNPEYRDPQFSKPNYVYVLVENRGDEATTGTEELHLYWAHASTGLSWKEHWVDNVEKMCQGEDRLFGAEITKPRKNAAAATETERDAYINAILEIGKNPTLNFSGMSYWHKQTEIHLNSGVHGEEAFLPWHREFINRYEILLQEVDPTVKLLYWDWTENPEKAPNPFKPNDPPFNFFESDFMGASGKGEPSPISIGAPFIPGLEPDLTSTFPGPKFDSIKRNFSGGLITGPTTVQDATLLNEISYQSFRINNEDNAHNPSHHYIGGTPGVSNMVTMRSPEDPFFFLLHANADRLWAKWQRKLDEQSRLAPTTAYSGTNGMTSFMAPWNGTDNVAPWLTGSITVVEKSPVHASVVSPPIYDDAPLVIPKLEKGQAVILEIPWYPPNPEDFSIDCDGTKLSKLDQRHMCLLGRIEEPGKTSLGMAVTEISSVNDNTRNNNNIAWRNVSVVDKLPGSKRISSVFVRNVFDEPVLTTLRFENTDEIGTSFFDFGRISVDLPQEISDRLGDGIVSENVEFSDGRILILAPDASIQNIPLEPNELFPLNVEFELSDDYIPREGLISKWDIIQAGTPDDPDEVVGGQRFEVNFQKLAPIASGSEWHYLDDGSLPPQNWTSAEFDDASWRQGKAELGFGDSPVMIIRGEHPDQRHITTYFRHVFDVTDPDFFRSLLLRLKRDDGAVVYLNEEEIYRVNLPDGTITPETLALRSVNGLEEEVFFPIPISENLSLLRQGQNVIAVEIHQDSLESADLSFDLELAANSAVTQFPPDVAFAEPTNGALLQADQIIPIEVEALDTDGEIVSVSLSVGDQYLGTLSQPPYSFQWENAPLGTHLLRAVARDADGEQGAVNLTITVVENTPPNVTLIAAANGTMFRVGETIQFSARTSDPGGAVARVEYRLMDMAEMFTAGTEVVGSAEAPPYAFDLTGLAPGHYMLSAVAFDNLGLSSQSLPISFHVHAVERKVGGVVWSDNDGDGIQDEDEPTLGGITVNLLTKDGTLIDSTETNDDGTYSFPGVDPRASYIIEVERPANKLFTSPGGDSDVDPATGHSPPVAIPADGFVNVSAGLMNKSGLIGDIVFKDNNRNGIQDAGEAGVEGVTVRLLDKSRNEIASTTTSSNGEYKFTIEPNIPYIIEFVKPNGFNFTIQNAQGSTQLNDSDADPATGQTGPISVGPDENDTSIDAGLVNQPGSITGHVWNDANRSGIQDSDELGIEGIDVKLWIKSTGGNLYATTTTDSNGNYLFTDVNPKLTYNIQVMVPQNKEVTEVDVGDDDTVDSDITADGVSQESVQIDPDGTIAIDGGLINKSASIGNKVFNDINRDGIQGPGEPGVPDISVELQTKDGTVIQTTVTDGNGSYIFTDVDPNESSYIIVFDVPDSQEFSPQDQGSDDTIDSDPNNEGKVENIILGPNDDNGTIDAGITDRRGKISGIVTKDGEGQPGVTVQLQDKGGNALTATVTDVDGTYEFDGLSPDDSFVVVIMAPDSARFPEGQDGTSGRLDIGPGSQITFDQTLESKSATLGNQVFSDDNRNGIQDAGEDGISGVTVNLMDKDKNIIRATTTDGDGMYEFGDVNPGASYIIQFVLPNGRDFTTPNVGPDVDDSDVTDLASGQTDPVTVGVDETDSTIDAGMVYRTPTISDKVFRDLDNDGIHDAGEPGEAGVKVDLLTTSGTVVMSTTADEDGKYIFTDIDPDEEYTVKVVSPDGDADNDIDIALCPDGNTLDCGGGETPGLATEFDLALRKTIREAEKMVLDGEPVAFRIEVCNQGNVSASDILIVDYIPDAFDLSDTDTLWDQTGSQAVRTIAGPLAPGDCTTEQITLIANFSSEGSSFEFASNKAEIVRAKDSAGNVRTSDIDSAYDRVELNDSVIDDEVNLTPAEGDEDDHDKAIVQVLRHDLGYTGDVNGDGTQTAVDALHLLRDEVGIAPLPVSEPDLSGAGSQAAIDTWCADIGAFDHNDSDVSGDFDGDGVCDGDDYGAYVCDVSGDNQCNSIDAFFVLQCDVGLSNAFCAQ